MDESLREREQRAAQNQLLFREVNERIASLAGRALLPDIAPIQVTCECVAVMHDGRPDSASRVR